MLDSHFPTMDPADPYRLTAEENAIMERLAAAFQNCEKLQHMRFLLAKGVFIRYTTETCCITAASP